MTDTELQELRQWSAELMGWTLKGSTDECGDKSGEWWKDDKYTGYDAYYIHSDGVDVSEDLSFAWRPDDPSTGQIWLFVEQMMELGWYLYCEPEPNLTFPGFEMGIIIYEIGFYHPERQKIQQKPDRGCGMFTKISPDAILLAAKATEEPK